MGIVVLGACGMMGHMAASVLAEQHEVLGTIRDDLPFDSALAIFLPPDRWVRGVEASDMASIERAFEETQPDAVFNCIGIIKQAPGATDPTLSIRNNALFPHQLAVACKRWVPG